MSTTAKSTKADKARIDYLIGKYFAIDTILAAAEDDLGNYCPDQFQARPELLAAMRVALDEARVELLGRRKGVEIELAALGVDLTTGEWAREDFQHTVRTEGNEGSKEDSRCAYCGDPASGDYAVHRDGLGVGPEVPLCAQCVGPGGPSLSVIWDRIAVRPSGPAACAMMVEAGGAD